jgi:hypothetical protein
MLKHIINEVFSSKNIIINTSNILIYVIVIILFFIYVISQQIENIILNKIDILIMIANHDPFVKKNLIDYIKNNDLSSAAKTQNNIRFQYNMDLLNINILPYLYILIAIIAADIIYIVFEKIKMTTAEIVLFLSIFCGFITEILFYFIVIKNWNFIGDHELYEILYRNINEI